MFAFRDSTPATGGFGLILSEALRLSAARSTAGRFRLKRFFVYDDELAVQAFARSLDQARRSFGGYHEHYENLAWALRQSQSLLVVAHADVFHYMCSDSAGEFDDLPVHPERLKGYLENFRGVRSRYTYGNLSPVTST